ncbi:hypoxanthine phosphoribosyltransferase [Algoriphagus boseongensis]|uniref:Hypoxanthine phosphoribosyltransferase n=1 Tax=Algoriphagus boseongensis TaxID=1442587 RepID=A0A4R6T7J3_9BACT|nr:hypoxanthine phosphoribosyltransferase [Algoriphagus boseongensis]TDQ17602.1 hypoxanthine phosphoribosyltransferase [Algoriphagus boseongensis]
MQKIKIHDKVFEPYLTADRIRARIAELGKEISNDFVGEKVILLGVLNGSFIVMADLAREIDLHVTCEFLRISSYSGIETTGKVKSILGLNIDLKDCSVIIVEDIVDTGISMKYLVEELEKQKPKKIAIATLLFKKEAFRFNYPLDYVGFEIPNKFVVGYGLDYDGLGRNLKDIYQLSIT